MTIPTYRLIADSEVDPESPVTSSLMFALRDNFLAVFGFDSTANPPVFGVPLTRVVRGYAALSSTPTNWSIPAGKYKASLTIEYSDANTGAGNFSANTLEGIMEIKSGGLFTDCFSTGVPTVDPTTPPGVVYTNREKADGVSTISLGMGTFISGGTPSVGTATLTITATGFNVSSSNGGFSGYYVNFIFVAIPVV